MGTYYITVEAVGNHGCSRETQTGESIEYCEQENCVDCQARNFVQGLQQRGSSITKATLTHWPGQENSVKDNLVTGIREEGCFRPAPSRSED